MRCLVTAIRGVRAWWRGSLSGEPSLGLHDLIGEPRYRITQPGNPFKAKRTWEKSMRVYINARKSA